MSGGSSNSSSLSAGPALAGLDSFVNSQPSYQDTTAAQNASLQQRNAATMGQPQGAGVSESDASNAWKMGQQGQQALQQPQQQGSSGNSNFALDLISSFF
jgi:hypothetical protein